MIASTQLASILKSPKARFTDDEIHSLMDKCQDTNFDDDVWIEDLIIEIKDRKGFLKKIWDNPNLFPSTPTELPEEEYISDHSHPFEKGKIVISRYLEDRYYAIGHLNLRQILFIVDLDSVKQIEKSADIEAH